ncbi:hypothetical protein P3S68_004837 [Capsicum galapagoense]
MYHAIIVDPIGLAGGLCLLWNDEVQVCQHHSTSFYIETYVHDITVNSKQWFMFVYLSMDKAIRRNQLQELCVRYNSWGPMWVMAGDFNDIRDNSKKIGGRVQDESSFTDFKNFLWEIGAIDLGFTGKPWTWWCYRENNGIIQERLDRDLCSPEWTLQFNQANINHLETEASDHSALLINSELSPIKRKKKILF